MTRLVSGVFAAMILLLGCQAVEPLRVVVPLNFSAFLPCLADKKLGRGFHSSDIKLEWVEDTSAAVTKMSEGHADVGVLTLPSLVSALKDRRDYRIVSEILNSMRSVSLVVKASSKILTARQLVGKKVGLVSGADSEIFLEYFLLTEGVNLGSIRKANFDRDTLIQEFVAGRIDAMVMGEPYLSRMKQRHPNLALREFYSFVHESKSVLVGAKKTLERDQARIDQLLSAWIKAERLLVESPELAQTLIAKCLSLDAGAMEFMKPAFLGSRSEIKLTNSLRQMFERSREWEILRGHSAEADIPVFTDVVDQSFLQRTRSRAITLGQGT